MQVPKNASTGTHSGFKTQSRRHQMSQYRGVTGPQRRPQLLKKNKREKIEEQRKRVARTGDMNRRRPSDLRPQHGNWILLKLSENQRVLSMSGFQWQIPVTRDLNLDAD